MYRHFKNYAIQHLELAKTPAREKKLNILCDWLEEIFCDAPSVLIFMKLQAPGSCWLGAGSYIAAVMCPRPGPGCPELAHPMSPPAAGQTGSVLLIIKTFRDHFSHLQNKSGAHLMLSQETGTITRQVIQVDPFLYLLSANLLMIFVTRKESANQPPPLGSIRKMKNCCQL